MLIYHKITHMPSLYFKTEGLVMKKMPFGEAVFLIRFFTKDFGKMDVLARSARKSLSKLNSHLDILNHIRLQFVKMSPPSDLASERIPTLTDAETIARFDDWFLDADKLSLAGRALQTIDVVVMPGSKDEELFKIIIDFFGGEQSEKKAIEFLRRFFLHEGHGDALPPEHEQAILRLWPLLKN